MQAAEMKKIETQAADRMQKTRMALLLKPQMAFGLGSLILRLKPVAAWWHDTAATDGKHLFYNPAYVLAQSAAKLQGLGLHEVLHCANGHPWRMGDRDPRLANIAMDLAINPICLDAGYELPDGALLDERFNNMAWEQIYAILKQEQDEDKKKQRDQGERGTPQAGEGQDGQGDDQDDDGQDGSDEASAGQDGEDQGNGKPAPGTAQPGRGGADVRDPRTPRYKPTFGEVVTAAPETAAQNEAEWKKAVQQVLETHGKLPQNLQRLVKEFVEPRVDWRAVLRRFVQQVAAADYTWREPSPRYMHMGTYLPRLKSEALPPIVVFDDTSGSTQAHQQQFFSELGAIMEEARPEKVIFIQGDAQVQKVDELQPGDPIVQDMRGGGGTDFRPMFEHVDEEQYMPACAIFLTDCMGDYPEQAPDYPVLWASTVPLDRLNTSYHPPFGEFIYIGDDR